jgi:AFG3 family protein
VCNEAALIAARADKPSIELSDFERASDRVIGGLEKKSSGMSPEEKALVAHHEAGHAVAAWFLEHADPLLKVTIVPRGNGALGFAQYLPKELSLYHQAQLADMMAMALGGRAAEQLFFGRVSTGASDDLQKVTRIAQAQVATYGMSERLGNVSYAPGQDDNQFVKPFSEATAQAIDEEVRALISVTYKRVLALLEKHRAQVKALADKLIETENVNHDVLLALLGPRPFASDAYTTWRKQSAEAAELLAKSKADKEKAAKDAAEAAAAAEKDAQGTPEFTPA